MVSVSPATHLTLRSSSHRFLGQREEEPRMSIPGSTTSCSSLPPRISGSGWSGVVPMSVRKSAGNLGQIIGARALVMCVTLSHCATPHHTTSDHPTHHIAPTHITPHHTTPHHALSSPHSTRPNPIPAHPKLTRRWIGT